MTKDNKPVKSRVPKKPPNFLLILAIVIFISLLITYGRTAISEKVLTVGDKEFLQLMSDGKIDEIWITDDEVVGIPKGTFVKNVSGERKEYTKIRAVIPHVYIQDYEGYKDLIKNIQPEKVHYNPPNSFLYNYLLPLLPWVILFLIIWYFLFRQMRAIGGDARGIMNFGRSRATFASEERRRVTFADVAGIDEAKEEVKEIIEYLKTPSRFKKMGGRIPRGILLVGAPGTGKTLLAKAIAGEARVPFLNMSGSDFVEMFVGVGASRVRDLFERAKKNAPCIVFLDEIDAVGRKRGSGLGGGHDEREQTLNAILVEMDGFDTDTGVIVIAATNRPDILDPALLRPGRFDREVVIDMPDLKGREEILKVHAKKVKLANDVQLCVIARTTAGFSGAELEALINEAALIAVAKNKDAITQPELEEARDKVRWGKQKRSKVMTEEDKKIIACHESGHAVVGKLIPEIEPLHKVTIIPRGMSLGSTMTMPEKDRYHLQKGYALAQIAFLLGGRVAEEICCGDISAGARDDIKKATELARLMVCEWGMGKMGPINYSENEDTVFLGREITRTRNHSEETANHIDTEVREIMQCCYKRAKDLLLANKDKLEEVVKALLKYETLSGEDIKKIVQGGTLDKNAASSNTTAEVQVSDTKSPEEQKSPPEERGSKRIVAKPQEI